MRIVGIPNSMSISANPITPSPILRLDFVSFSISGRGLPVHFYYIVQKTNCCPDSIAQLEIIDLLLSIIIRDHMGQVYRSEIA
jgi:hypothetical protein